MHLKKAIPRWLAMPAFANEDPADEPTRVNLFLLRLNAELLAEIRYLQSVMELDQLTREYIGSAAQPVA